MNLILNTSFKSLAPLNVELPDFVILTGLNGAGKTQLLMAINEGKMGIFDEQQVALNPVKYVTSLSLSPNDSVVITREQMSQYSNNGWNFYKESLPTVQAQNSNGNTYSFAKRGSDYGANSMQEFYGKAIDKMADMLHKNIDSLDVNDFYEHFPIEASTGQNDVFYQNFSPLFKKYVDRLENNEYKRFLNETRGQKEALFLSDEQFLESYGEAPWNFVNKIITEAKLDYRINSPIGIDRDAPFELKLINNFNGAEIKFSDLSSGEKVLMSLALALYNSRYDIEFPKVLLMDEPDASLHPSMVKQFLDVIQNIFVKEKRVKVIVTTHSPSTVALAPDKALYVVNKTGQRVEKISKDGALKILTSGVPSFSVLYENRRQVFVESPNDVLFYEGLYQRLSGYLNQEVSLTFISSGDSRTDKNGAKVSNCGQVINIVNILRGDQNKFIWGIIDWDRKNVSTEFIKVLGNGKRYSIESYVFDPLILGAFLLREKIISRDEMGLSTGEDYTDLMHGGNRLMQIVADYVVTAVQSKLDEKGIWSIMQPDVSVVKVVTASNNLFNIPVWYFHYQGHELEKILLDVFPKLHIFKRQAEAALKLEIIRKVVDDYPGMVPIDIIEVFREVQHL